MGIRIAKTYNNNTIPKIVILILMVVLLNSVLNSTILDNNTHIVFSINMPNNRNDVKGAVDSYFEFIYEESGSGIAGPRQVNISYDSTTNILKVIDKLRNSIILQKHLSDLEEGNLKDLIIQTGFFTTKDSYLPSSLTLKGCMDCLNYNLDVKVNKQVHSTKWRSDSSVPIGLWTVTNAIKNMSK
jgi:hypothetical protein